MRSLIVGFSGWAKMQQSRSEKIRVVDTAITVVGTLLIALTWAILRH